MLYGVNGEVPDQYYETPIGIPKILEPGEDLTIIAWSGMIPVAQDVSGKLKEKSIQCEMIDLRTLNPIELSNYACYCREECQNYRRPRFEFKENDGCYKW